MSEDESYSIIRDYNEIPDFMVVDHKAWQKVHEEMLATMLEASLQAQKVQEERERPFRKTPRDILRLGRFGSIGSIVKYCEIIRTVGMKQMVPVKIDGEVVGKAEVDLETGMGTVWFDEGKKPAGLNDCHSCGISLGIIEAGLFTEPEMTVLGETKLETPKYEGPALARVVEDDAGEL